MDAYELPDGTITQDASKAAELWATAFYSAKDALARIRPVPELILAAQPIRDLSETLAECDSVLSLGAK